VRIYEAPAPFSDLLERAQLLPSKPPPLIKCVRKCVRGCIGGYVRENVGECMSVWLLCNGVLGWDCGKKVWEWRCVRDREKLCWGVCG
jgi:hypothetical protein